MKIGVLTPIAVTDVLFNNIVADDIAPWVLSAAVTTVAFAKDAQVYESASHTRYRAVIDAPIGAALTNTLFFSEQGWINKWAFLDGKINTQSIGPIGELILEISVTELMNVLSLLNSFCKTIKIELIDTAGTVQKTYGPISMIDYSGEKNVVTYLWEPYRYKSDFFLEIPPINSGKIRITMDGGLGSAKLGILSFGRTQYIGEVVWGVKTPLSSYAGFTTDRWGNTTYTDGESFKKLEGKIFYKSSQFDFNNRFMASIKGKLVLFIGDENDKGYESLTVLGSIESFIPSLNGPVGTEAEFVATGII